MESLSSLDASLSGAQLEVSGWRPDVASAAQEVVEKAAALDRRLAKLATKRFFAGSMAAAVAVVAVLVAFTEKLQALTH